MKASNLAWATCWFRGVQSPSNLSSNPYKFFILSILSQTHWWPLKLPDATYSQMSSVFMELPHALALFDVISFIFVRTTWGSASSAMLSESVFCIIDPCFCFTALNRVSSSWADNLIVNCCVNLSVFMFYFPHVKYNFALEWSFSVSSFLFSWELCRSWEMFDADFAYFPLLFFLLFSPARGGVVLGNCIVERSLSV